LTRQPKRPILVASLNGVAQMLLILVGVALIALHVACAGTLMGDL
jgi:hypothetical protein